MNFEIRDYFREPFTAEELLRLIGAAPLSELLSTRARSYKEHGWDRKIPAKKEAIAAIIADPTLLRRPILIAGRKILIGFSQTAYESLIASQ